MKATGNATCASDLKILIQKDGTIWLVNTSDKVMDIKPGELFGFGLGSFTESITSQAKLDKSILMFQMKRDSDLVVFQEEGGPKSCIALANLIFQQAQKHGLVDVSVVDHKLTGMLEAHRLSQLIHKDFFCFRLFDFYYYYYYYYYYY